MSSTEVVFRDRYGMHPRAAMRIQTMAATYAAAIAIEPLDGGSPIDARSMLALVSSGVRLGDRLRASATGPDAEAAVAAIGGLITAGICHP